MIVSESFNYRDTQWLCEFARLFDRATDAERGYDTTIKTALPEEEQVFRDIVTKHVEVQVGPDSDIVDIFVGMLYEKNRVYKVALCPHPPPGEAEVKEVALENDSPSCNYVEFDGKSATGDAAEEVNAALDVKRDARSICRDYSAIQYFLVSRPIEAPLSISGRGTRGYWAVKTPDKDVDKGEHKIAFLKDTWRVDASGMEKEGEIMIELVEAKVSNVSDIYCHGDVLEDDATLDYSKSIHWNTLYLTNGTCRPAYINRSI